MKIRSEWIYLCSSWLFSCGGGVVVRGRLSRPWRRQFKSFISVCKQFVSVRWKNSTHTPQKCVPSEGPGWFCCLLSPRDWYFVCWLKWWNSEFSLGFVMFGLAYSASSLRPPDRKLARVHVWLHHVCGATQNPPLCLLRLDLTMMAPQWKVH